MDNLFNSNQDIISQYIIPWGINIAFAIAIFVVGRFVAKILVKAAKSLMEKAGVEEILRGFIGNILNVVLMVFVLIAALEKLGVDTTSIMAIFAAAGLAVGLALKDSLANFSAGVMLIMFKPFKVGDFINAAGVSGTVETIRIFNTVMRSGDNQEIIVPNSGIYGGNITNVTARDTRRIDLVIGIGYDDNIAEAKKLLEDIIAKNDKILTDPAPAIMVAELGESSVDLAVRPWVNTADYWGVRSEMLQRVKEVFDEKGISIPYPQRDLHLIGQEVSVKAS